MQHIASLLDIDPNPEQQEESPKAHKERGHGSNDQFFHDLPGELGGCDLQIYVLHLRCMQVIHTSYTKNQAVKKSPIPSRTRVRWGKTAGLMGET